MCGVGELGLASGLSHIVTVTDVFLERMFKRMGCPGERIADPQRIERSRRWLSPGRLATICSIG